MPKKLKIAVRKDDGQATITVPKHIMNSLPHDGEKELKWTVRFTGVSIIYTMVLPPRELSEEEQLRKDFGRGAMLTRQDFIDEFGEENGQEMWEEAEDEREREVAILKEEMETLKQEQVQVPKRAKDQDKTKV